jgi:hypothetical protein
MAAARWSGVKVFAATSARERERLGDRVMVWLRAHPGLKPIGVTVLESGDSSFRCLTVTILFIPEPRS